MQVYGDAIRAARGARARLAAPDEADGAIADLLAAAERIAGVHVLVLDLPETLAGAYARRSTGPLVFLNGRHHVVRQRFTLAHELGHHWLDHPTTVDDLRALSGTQRDPAELQANLFAAELLMPHAATRAWCDAHLAGRAPPSLDDVLRLAAHFHVSAMAARIRLQTVGRLSDGRRAAMLDAEIAEGLHHDRRAGLGLAACADGLIEASRHLPRIPASVAPTVLGRILSGELSIAAAAAASGRRAGEIEASLTRLRLGALLPAPPA